MYRALIHPVGASYYVARHSLFLRSCTFNKNLTVAWFDTVGVSQGWRADSRDAEDTQPCRQESIGLGHGEGMDSFASPFAARVVQKPESNVQPPVMSPPNPLQAEIQGRVK